MKYLLIVLSILAISTESYAARVSTGWFKIVEAGADSNGPFIAVPESGTVNNCPNGFNWGIGSAQLTAEGYSSSVSVVLAAMMANKKIKVEYEDSTSGCYVYKVRVQ
ncbi:MAG: hypothetical protein K6L81_06195 [Agarilytica sp.]